jgi:hypothetical protein
MHYCIRPRYILPAAEGEGNEQSSTPGSEEGRLRTRKPAEETDSAAANPAGTRKRKREKEMEQEAQVGGQRLEGSSDTKLT